MLLIHSFVGKNFAICVDDDGKFVPAGGIGLKTTNNSNTQHAVELGYWLGEQYWGHGIVSEAVSLVVNYAFSDQFTKFNKDTKVLRIEACIFEHNQPSAKVLTKNGFTFESLKKHAYVKDGKLINGLMYTKFKE